MEASRLRLRSKGRSCRTRLQLGSEWVRLGDCLVPGLGECLHGNHEKNRYKGKSTGRLNTASLPSIPPKYPTLHLCSLGWPPGFPPVSWGWAPVLWDASRIGMSRASLWRDFWIQCKGPWKLISCLNTFGVRLGITGVGKVVGKGAADMGALQKTQLSGMNEWGHKMALLPQPNALKKKMFSLV